jgi:hypothetical protein
LTADEQHKGGMMRLEINIQDETKIQSKRDDGQEKTGSVQMDPLRMNTIRILRNLLEKDYLKERQELEVLGSHLYLGIFNGDIDTEFQRALTDSKKKNEKLRVKLYFQQAAIKLATLPWEYLYKPGTETGEGYFLSSRTELTLFRYMPRDEAAQNEDSAEELKVLVVFAETNGAQPSAKGDDEVTDAGKIKADMETLFKNLKVKVDFLDKPTAGSLPPKIDEFNPHVLHFIGHGLISKEGDKSRIAVLDDNGKLRFIPDQLFADYVTKSAKRDLRLVFLHLTACSHPEEINLRENYASFAGMAPALIKANIPAVVAMQFPVKTVVAKKFYESFYKELAGGADIDSAVQTGRRTIHLDPEYYETPTFGSPVLFVHREDGIVKRLPAGTGESSEKSSIQKPEPPPEETKPRTSESKEFIDKSVVQMIDASTLRKKAYASMELLDLGQEQKNSIAKIISQLYLEKKGQGNYKGVLEGALSECADIQVQHVIGDMLQELEA